jgi:hypothetical protein
MTRSTRKNLLKTMDPTPFPSAPGEMPEGKRGDQQWWTAALWFIGILL